jgi:hypothetical protein
MHAPSARDRRFTDRLNVDTRPAGPETVAMEWLMTNETVATLIATAGVIILLVAWRCWRD